MPFVTNWLEVFVDSEELKNRLLNSDVFFIVVTKTNVDGKAASCLVWTSAMTN